MSNDHKLYHEAQRRAKLPQLLIKHTKPKSVLLSAPNNMIFDLFNTIIKEVSSAKLLDYVTQNLRVYLIANWGTKITQQVVRRLQREQAIDVRAGLTKANHSRISSVDGLNKVDEHQSNRADLANQKSPTNSMDRSMKEVKKRVEQVYEHVMWRITSGNVSQITSILIKLVLDDGYKTGKLKAEVYDEVVGCFKDWRSLKLIKLYAFGDAPANDQKLILANTTAGNLTRWVANYIDGSEKRQDPDLIRKLAAALRDKTKNCIFITNNIDDAMQSLSTGALRMAFVVDRLDHYDVNLGSLRKDDDPRKSSIINGKLYVMNSLDCIEFAPDPTTDSCC